MKAHKRLMQSLRDIEANARKQRILSNPGPSQVRRKPYVPSFASRSRLSVLCAVAATIAIPYQIRGRDR